MTKQEFDYALDYLLSQTTTDPDTGEEERFRLPYGIRPDEHPLGNPIIFHFKADWDEYYWNPPQHWSNDDRYRTPDNTASAKPTWERLQAAIEPGWRLHNVPIIKAKIKKERVRRMMAETGTETETELLLYLIENPVGGAALNTLRARSNQMITYIEDSERTREEIESLKYISNSEWRSI